MESEPKIQDCSKLSRSSRLRIFTKLLSEPIVVSGSAYRSGAHPVLAARVAVEVARSPKQGLVERLMVESRDAFHVNDYPTAIVKSLAAEELLRKYGRILFAEDEKKLREQLQFLKIQYFLLSGQAREAYKVLKSLRHRVHPYLWHSRMATRSGVCAAHWRSLEKTLRLFFKTHRDGKVFALLGYAIAMGSEPTRALGLAEELNFLPNQGERMYQSLCKDYVLVTTGTCKKNRELCPEYLAKEFAVTPLIQLGETLFLGAVEGLSEVSAKEIEVRVGLETVIVPMLAKSIKDRNDALYAN